MMTCLRYLTLSAALVGFGQDLQAGGTAPPQKLTPDTYEAIKKRVSLTPEDLAWQQVRWRDSFFQGLMDAQAADKPLFFWFYGGGPLAGNC